MPPAVASPELRLADLTDLCSYGHRPHVITGLLVQLYRQHFADRDSIEDPALRDWLWTPLDSTGIVIESITRWRPGVSMVRPSVVVKPGGLQFVRLGINDALAGLFTYDGSDYYAGLLAGDHTVFAMANEAGEAERLAAEVYRELVQYSAVLRDYFQLHRLVLMGVGPLARLPESIGGYVRPVNVAYVYEDAWRIESNEPVLKRIILENVVACMT